MAPKAEESKSLPGVLVPKPTRMPYINFCQAFRQSYQGSAKKPTEMVKMAAATWRKLTEAEKAPYVRMAEQQKAKGGFSRSTNRKTKRLQKTPGTRKGRPAYSDCSCRSCRSDSS